MRKFLPLALTLAACAPDPSGHGFTVRDSAGIRIVENPAPQWSTREAWRVEREPTLVIGTRDGPPEQQLFGASAATRLADGRIAIGDASDQIRVYRPDGTFSHAIGRRGSGPGEFRGIREIYRQGDTLIVHDGSEVERFTALGDFIDGGYGSAPALAAAVKEGFASVGAFPLWDDSWLLAGQPPDPRAHGLYDIHRQPSVYMRYDAARGLDTLATLPFVDMFFMMNDGQKSVGRPLFANISLYEIAWAARRVILGDPAPPEIRVFPDGEPETRVRWSPPDRQITPQDLAWERDRREALAQAQSGPAAAAIRALWIRPLDRIPDPEYAPAFVALESDVLGNIWLKEHPRPHHTTDHWRVFDPAGCELGIVEIETDLFPLEIGPDYLLALHQDDLDIQRVRLHPLLKPSPAPAP